MGAGDAVADGKGALEIRRDLAIRPQAEWSLARPCEQRMTIVFGSHRMIL
jgi:hypothetical protein